MAKRKHFYKQNVSCHLCGFVIPQEIISPEHDLFGTIDHVVPWALGGTNKPSNLKPAHRFCNIKKGCRPVTPKLTRTCIVHVYALVLKMPEIKSKYARKFSALKAAMKVATITERVPNA